MPRKKKYENAEIARSIIRREAKNIGDTEGYFFFENLDFKKKDDREFFIGQAKDFIKIFQRAIEELEGNNK